MRIKATYLRYKCPLFTEGSCGCWNHDSDDRSKGVLVMVDQKGVLEVDRKGVLVVVD